MLCFAFFKLPLLIQSFFNIPFQSSFKQAPFYSFTTTDKWGYQQSSTDSFLYLLLFKVKRFEGHEWYIYDV